MADCWGPMLRKNSLSWSLNRLQLSLYQQAGGTRSKYNYWRRKGLESSCWVAMIRHPVRRLGERCLASVTPACAIPSVVAFVNTGAVVIHGKYRSTEVNKTIVISIIDRNVYRWVAAKRWFSQHDQKRRPIRSVTEPAIVSLRFTNGRTKCDTKTAQINKKK